MVTNCGNVDFDMLTWEDWYNSVALNSSQIAALVSSGTIPTSLAVEATAWFELTTPWASGQQNNTVCVEGYNETYDMSDEDCDPAYYYGPTMMAGCTPGFWKNHPGNWPCDTDAEPDLLCPNTQLDAVFNCTAQYEGSGKKDIKSTDTLMDALNYGGGNGPEGAARILLRSAVSALLNQATFGEAYPDDYVGYDGLLEAINAALCSGDRDTMLMLYGDLDDWNNTCCPECGPDEDGTCMNWWEPNYWGDYLECFDEYF